MVSPQRAPLILLGTFWVHIKHVDLSDKKRLRRIQSQAQFVACTTNHNILKGLMAKQTESMKTAEEKEIEQNRNYMQKLVKITYF